MSDEQPDSPPRARLGSSFIAHRSALLKMSQMSSPTIAALSFNHPTRPMLARDADSMYWMSRYVERAEHIARIMWVNANLLVDVGDLAPALQERQWESVLTIFHVNSPP